MNGTPRPAAPRERRGTQPDPVLRIVCPPGDTERDALGRKEREAPGWRCRRSSIHRAALATSVALVLGASIGGCGGASGTSDAIPKSSPDITPPTDTSAEKAAAQTTSTSTTSTTSKGTSGAGSSSESSSGEAGKGESGGESSGGESSGESTKGGGAGGTSAEKEKASSEGGGSKAGGEASPSGGASAP